MHNIVTVKLGSNVPVHGTKPNPYDYMFVSLERSRHDSLIKCR